MHVVKTLFVSVAASCVLIGLTGCDSEADKAQSFIQQTAASAHPEQLKAFHRKVGDLDITITYRYKDDVILSQTAQNTIPYRVLPATNRAEAMNRMNKISDVYHQLPGVVQKVEFLNGRAHENLTVDFTKATIKQLCGLKDISVGMIITDCSAKYLTMSGVEKFMREQEFETLTF